MATLLPQMVVDYQSFVVGIEAVAVVELAAGNCFVGYIVDYNPVGFVVFVIVVVVGSFLGFVVGTETAVVELAVVTVELDHYNLIVDFVDSLRVRKPTFYASAHIEYKLQRYT